MDSDFYEVLIQHSDGRSWSFPIFVAKETQTATVTGLTTGTTYYFLVRTEDTSYNLSNGITKMGTAG